MEDNEVLEMLLRVYFNNEYYEDAIQSIRQDIAAHPSSKTNWSRAADMIRNRRLLPGQPLTLIHDAANQVLYENTDEEAYNWLDKMVRNVEQAEEPIEPY